MDQGDLEALGRTIVDAVCDLFRARGAWPTFAILDRRLDRRHQIDAQAALNAIPRSYIRRDRFSQAYQDNDEVRLTLRGLASCPDSAEDLATLTDFVGWVARRERNHDPDETGHPLIVTSDEAAAELGLDTTSEEDAATIGRLWKLIDLVPDLSAGSSWRDDPPWWQLTVSRAVRTYRDLSGPDDLARRADEYWARADEAFGRLPDQHRVRTTASPATTTSGQPPFETHHDRKPGLVRPEAVDELREIATAPFIASAIVDSLRHADERSQVEPALMRVIGEVDETPHGPTEIADITTAHLRVLGRPAFAGIVIKGKASRTVRATEIADQLQRAAALPSVGLIVLAAVGDIQDDAKQRLAWLADRVKADWLILDRGDLARLFVAYGELCPNDGSWLGGKACAKCDYRRPASGRVSRPPYTILSLEDVSTGGAKRYGVHLLVPPGLRDDEIEARVRTAIPALRAQRYSRNKQVESAHGRRLADVVFLFVYEDVTDRPFANWICRALWVSPDLDERFAPTRLGTPDSIDTALQVQWNSTYDVMAALLADRLDKGTYLRDLDRYLAAADRIVAEARSILEASTTARKGDKALADLAQRIDDLPRPDRSRAAPHELADLDTAFEGVDSNLVDLGLFFTKRGREVGPEAATRRRLGLKAINDYEADLAKLKFERFKVK